MHVVFDLDGVLLDSESDLAWLDRALSATLHEFDIEVTEENLARLYPGNIGELEAAAEYFDVPINSLWETRNGHYLREKIAAIESGEIGPFEDIEVLEAIAEEYPVSIISNSPEAVVDAFLEMNGLADTIDHSVGRGTTLSAIGRLKPDPYLYEELHDRADAEQYVYIGDMPDDETFAERTDMAYIHLDRTNGPIDSLEAVRERLRELDD